MAALMNAAITCHDFEKRIIKKQEMYFLAEAPISISRKKQKKN